MYTDLESKHSRNLRGVIEPQLRRNTLVYLAYYELILTDIC